MNKKTLSLILVSLLLIMTSLQVASAHPPASGGVPTDPDHFVIDRENNLQTVDPAWANDATSQEIIQNVYDTLIFFDRDYILGPYGAGLINQFVPRLATNLGFITPINVPIPGLSIPKTFVQQWNFTIRPGIMFHDGSIMTPADVEYSFERLMVQDRTGGPSWHLYQFLLGVNSAPNPSVEPNWGVAIDMAVEVVPPNHVIFRLVKPPSPDAFRRTLSQTWSSVAEKAWAVAKGDFDGNWAAGWATIYAMWHDPPVSFLDSPTPAMMGTGPYMFMIWDQVALYWSVSQYVNYWDGWPARVSDNPASPLYTHRICGPILKVTWTAAFPWTIRKLRFQFGDSDETDVPVANILDVLGYYPGAPGSPTGDLWHRATYPGTTTPVPVIRCFYPLSGMSPPNDRHWERDWMRGWYFNPLYPGEYVYHRWKAHTHFGDTNNDGLVDLADLSFLSASWTNPAGPGGYNPNADINGGTGDAGPYGGPSIVGLVPGISDGRVDMADLTLVSAYWDNPQGPMHP